MKVELRPFLLALFTLPLLVACNNDREGVKGINITGSTNLTGWVAIIYADPSAQRLPINDNLAQINVSTSNVIRTSSKALPTATWYLESQEVAPHSSPPEAIAIRKVGNGSYKSATTTVNYSYVFVGTKTDFENAQDLEIIVGPIARDVAEIMRSFR